MTSNNPVLSSSPLSVFISYSHKDEDLREELEVHLANLKRQGKILAWNDREIEAGTEWDAEIKHQLERASVILLLISPPFMASKYCYDLEMQRAVQRHHEGTARVIPIILRPVDWKGSPFSPLQVLPKDAKPVTQWGDRDSAFLNVVQGVRRAVDALSQKVTHPPQPHPNEDRYQRVRSAYSVFIAGPPISHPRHFFGREKQLKRLFNLLKTHPLQNAAIIGPQRSGKTSLLNYLRTITTTPPEELRPAQKTDWLAHPESYRWIFVDFQDARMAHQEQLLSYLLESMQLSVPDPFNLERFMDRVCGNIHTPTIVLMDEIGVGLKRCPELDDSFWESLRSLATNQTDGNLAFVLATPESPIDLAHQTGHSSPFFNIFGYTATLSPLIELKARELIASSPLPFSEEDITWILAKSGGWPLLLQMLCQVRLVSLEERDLGNNWQEEGLQQITQFSHLLDQL
jgi:hypothetical protein